ncbi:aquaporin NIP1-4 [Lolium perenne]|uniref:aquaporin NIP1-4 n=1 Tax=Lolium perenne TaxID=4522 RepID=UPI0021EA2190|nr:aquaporin NIP1-4-like [Lolium perenne]
MARREDDSAYTNGSVSMNDFSVEDGRKEKEVYADKQPADEDVVCGVPVSVTFLQMLLAELFSTFFLLFAGMAAIVVNSEKGGAVTFPGITVVWGMAVMVMIYTVGHISGAHMNPAVTVGFAIARRFPWKRVPAYMVVQMVAALIASVMLRLMFGGKHEFAPVTQPTGSNIQSLVVEFITTFYLVFVVMAVATDDRAVGQMAGLAVGATIMLNALFSGPVTGASMNPVRSIGPALVAGKFKSLWVYILGPFAGGAAGAWAYGLIRHIGKPQREITKTTDRSGH